jgi:hypothetical protein
MEATIGRLTAWTTSRQEDPVRGADRLRPGRPAPPVDDQELAGSADELKVTTCRKPTIPQS